MTRDEARAEWLKATTFRELCELMARFVEGALPCSPGGYDAMDEESAPLVPALAALNRSGFLTIDSQPGWLEGDCGQRAFVEGFALPETAQGIARKALYTPLYVGVLWPHMEASSADVWTEPGSRTPLAVADGHPYGWLIEPTNVRSAIAPFEEAGLTGEACADLERACWVAVVDLEWGRSDLLWRVLLEEPRSGYSIHPHPELEPR